MADLTLTFVLLGKLPASDHVASYDITYKTSVDNFRTMVHKRYENGLRGIDIGDLTVWKLNHPIQKKDIDATLSAFGHDLSGVAVKMAALDKISTYFNTIPPEGCLHIIVQPPVSQHSGSKRRRRGDFGDPAFEQPSKLQAKTEAPSKAADPSKFRHLVEGSDLKLRILCNRPVDYTTIPLALLYPVFGQFVDDCSSFKPGPDEHAYSHKLSVMADFFDSEIEKRFFFEVAFAKYFKIYLEVEMIADTNLKPDGYAYVVDSTTSKRYIFVIVQGKNEITYNHADPRFQAILNYREYARQFCRPTFLVSCLPAILLTYYAANFQVSGIITHPNGTVQSTILTETFPLDADWHDDEHWMRLARCLGALKNSFQTLSSYYTSLPSPLTVNVDNYPAMHFPYPKECGELKFEYISRVYPTRLIFSATDVVDHRPILIKFSRQYSVAAHQLLSESGQAPELYGTSELPGGWIMVAMEMVGHPWVILREVEPAKRMQFREPIKKLVESFHAREYVHGDIRESNIFVYPEDPNNGIKLIDFDEAGLEGVALYPRNLNTKTVQRPLDAADGNVITKEHDIFMMEKLFIDRI